MNNTRKLSGPSKDRFFKRLFVDVCGLDIPTADRLTEATSDFLSSVRVRKDLRLAGPVSPETSTGDEPSGAAPAPVNKEPFHPDPEPAFAPIRKPEAAPPPLNASELDAYAFGLVPVYKREGAEGLSARLAEIGSVEHLRAMAKAQQIVLSREMRAGDTDIDTLRTAILHAVEKRIADRRAI